LTGAGSKGKNQEKMKKAEAKTPRSHLFWGIYSGGIAPSDQPQARIAPQAVQNSQPSFLITAELPHSLHRVPDHAPVERARTRKEALDSIQGQVVSVAVPAE
jgi:hypothetical protein